LFRTQKQDIQGQWLEAAQSYATILAAIFAIGGGTLSTLLVVRMLAVDPLHLEMAQVRSTCVEQVAKLDQKMVDQVAKLDQKLVDQGAKLDQKLVEDSNRFGQLDRLQRTFDILLASK